MKYSFYTIIVSFFILLFFLMSYTFELEVLSYAMLSIPLIFIVSFVRSFTLTEFIFHPIFILFISLFLGTVLRLFFYASNIEDPLIKSFMVLNNQKETLLYGLLTLYLSLTMFMFGFLLKRWNYTKESAYRYKINPIYCNILFIFGLSVILISAVSFFINTALDLSMFSKFDQISVKRYGVTAEGINHSHGLLRAGMSLSKPLFLIALVYSSAKKKNSFWIIIFLFFCLISDFLSSQRFSFMLLIIGFLGYLIHDGVKLKKIILAFGVSLFVLILMSELRFDNTRHNMRVNGIQKATIANLNFIDVTKLGIIVANVPEKMDFMYGQTFFKWIIAPIPKKYWKDKPYINIGDEIAVYIYNKKTFNNPGGAVPPGIIGELYLNFWFFGIIIGMLIIGFVVRQLYLYLTLNFDNKKFRIIYFFYFIPWLLYLFESDFSRSLLIYGSSLFFFLLFFRLVSKKEKLQKRLSK